MSGRGIDDVPPASGRYQVSRFPGFETFDQCLEEDLCRKRGMLLAQRRYPESISEIEAMRFLIDFGEAESDGVTPESLGSSAYMYRLRDNVCSDINRIVNFYPKEFLDKHLRSFTIIPRTWEFSAGELADVDPRSLISAMRTALYEQEAAENDGWLIAFIHGEFDPIAKMFRLHVHGLAIGKIIQSVDRLRHLPNYQTQRLDKDGKPNPVYRRVRINRKPLTNFPHPITYLVQSFWPSRALLISDDGTRIRARRKSRIPEPYHSEVLLWLHRWRLTDLTLMIGLRVTLGGLVETDRVG